jgi:hypothetical protein
MGRTLFTLLPSVPSPPRVKHYLGLPPELTGGVDSRQELGPAYVLVIEESEEGTFLYRYDVDGRFVGDTWHETVDEAKDQAEHEYHLNILAWADLPSGITDAVKHALTKSKQGERR